MVFRLEKEYIAAVISKIIPVLARIIAFRRCVKKSIGSGASPVKIKGSGRFTFDPSHIPTIHAQLSHISINSSHPGYQSATVTRCLISS